MKTKFNFKPLSPQMGTSRVTATHASRVTPGGSCALKDIPVYTGSEMIGISIIHKSCLQPIFSREAAVDAASMRR